MRRITRINNNFELLNFKMNNCYTYKRAIGQSVQKVSRSHIPNIYQRLKISIRHLDRTLGL